MKKIILLLLSIAAIAGIAIATACLPYDRFE
ncbi:MAG: Vmc-like lipoprotein signal peptide domain-containing protein [Butyricicoccus sp.]